MESLKVNEFTTELTNFCFNYNSTVPITLLTEHNNIQNELNILDHVSDLSIILFMSGERSRTSLSGAQWCELRLLGLCGGQGQEQRQDRAGEDQDAGDDLRRAGQGGSQDHLHGS